MNKKGNENFMSSTKCWTCNNIFVKGDVETIVMLLPNSTHRECSTQRDCNINIKLNHKILIKFHNLKNYDSHLIMPELGKFNFKTNMIPNRF